MLKLNLEPILFSEDESEDDEEHISPFAGSFGSRTSWNELGQSMSRSSSMQHWDDEEEESKQGLCLSKSYAGLPGGYTIRVSKKGITLGGDGGREVAVEGQLEPSRLQLEQKVIGRGACSVVHLARDRVTGERYAIKSFSTLDKTKRRQLHQEIMTLLRGGCVANECPALVEFYGAYKVSDAKISVVLRYMDRGCLEDFLLQRRERWQGGDGRLHEQIVAAISYQIFCGLSFLHRRQHLHRDVKPSNVLLDSSGEAKLSDFGISRKLGHEQEEVDAVVGSVRYMSPERLRGEAYGWQADVWGLGLILIDCISAQGPWAGCSQVEILQMLKEKGNQGLLAGQHFSEALGDLLGSCLHLDSRARVSVEVLLQHKWFASHGVSSRVDAVRILGEYFGAHVR
ncbi:unnamed protein product [Chrysoparadoxa australica]